MTRAEQIRKQFAAFHRANPQVWDRFIYHTRSLMKRGATVYSARTLISVIRFERDMSSRDGATGFSINDHYTPYYGRMFEIAYPQHAGFFCKRKLTSEEHAPLLYEPGPGDMKADEPSTTLDVFLKELLDGD